MKFLLLVVVSLFFQVSVCRSVSAAIHNAVIVVVVTVVCRWSVPIWQLAKWHFAIAMLFYNLTNDLHQIYSSWLVMIFYIYTDSN